MASTNADTTPQAGIVDKFAEVISLRMAAVFGELSVQLCTEVRCALREELQTSAAAEAESIVRQLQPLFTEMTNVVEKWVRPPDLSILGHDCNDPSCGTESDSMGSSSGESSGAGGIHGVERVDHKFLLFNAINGPAPKEKHRHIGERISSWRSDLNTPSRKSKGSFIDEPRVNSAPSLPTASNSKDVDKNPKAQLVEKPIWATLPDLLVLHSDQSSKANRPVPVVPADSKENMRPAREPASPSGARAASMLPSPSKTSRKNQRATSMTKTSTLRNLEDLLSKELFAASSLVQYSDDMRYSLGTQDTKGCYSPRTSIASGKMLGTMGEAWGTRPAPLSQVRRPPGLPSHQSVKSRPAQGNMLPVRGTGQSLGLGAAVVSSQNPSFSPHGSPSKLEGRSVNSKVNVLASMSMENPSSPSAFSAAKHGDVPGVDSEGTAEYKRRSSRSSAGSNERRMMKIHSAPPATSESEANFDAETHSLASEQDSMDPRGCSKSRLTRLGSKTSFGKTHISLKVEGLRQLREKELTEDVVKQPSTPFFFQPIHSSNSPIAESPCDSPPSFEDDQDCFREHSPPPTKVPLGSVLVATMLRICGIIPWSSRRVCRLYPWLLIGIAALSVAICMRQLSRWSEHSSPFIGHFSDTAFASGALLALLCGRAFQREAHDCNVLLFSYASHKDFLDLWVHRSVTDALGTFAVWLLVVLERVRFFVMHRQGEGDSTLAALGLAAFVFSSGTIMILTHYVVYVSRCLSCMIDTFCCHFVGSPDFREAVAEWNVLQAVIRKACGSIQYCFFVLQTTTVVAALLSVVDAMNLETDEVLVLLPGAFVILAVTRVFFCAGAVTDKCARVPALVNSLSFGTILDRDRLYVVDYISHSQAGFYIFEIQVTSAVVVKLFYLSCVVAITFATRVVSFKA